MTVRAVQSGRVMNVRAGADVTGNSPGMFGDLLGVWAQDYKAGDMAAFIVAGVYTMPKLATDDIPAGAKVMWSDADGIGLAGDKDAGFAFEAAGAGVAEIAVLLNGMNAGD